MSISFYKSHSHWCSNFNDISTRHPTPIKVASPNSCVKSSFHRLQCCNMNTATLGYAIHILKSSECWCGSCLSCLLQRNAQLAQNRTVISWELHRERRQKWINAHMLGVKYSVNENTVYINIRKRTYICWCVAAKCALSVPNGMMYVHGVVGAANSQRKCFIYFYGVCWKM